MGIMFQLIFLKIFSASTEMIGIWFLFLVKYYFESGVKNVSLGTIHLVT